MTTHEDALARQKIFVLFKGHPGVGKSTVAQALARRLRCSLIDKDDARDCLSLLTDRIDGVPIPPCSCYGETLCFCA